MLGDFDVALEVEPTIVPHPVAVLTVLPETNAEEDVVGIMIFGLQEVRIVRGDDREAEIRGEREDALVELFLSVAPVGLHFEVVAARKTVGVPRCGVPGGTVVLDHEVRCQLPSHARRRNDQPFAVLLQQLAVDARTRIEPLGVAEGGEFDEVPVTGTVGREEDEMEIRFDVRADAASLASVAWGDVRLHAYDWP